MIKELNIPKSPLCAQSIDSVKNTINELKSLYNASLPYIEIKLLEGTCYIWSEKFLDKCEYSMSTNIISHMFTTEQKIWNEYILWSDNASSSANNSTTNAIGCTILNEQNKSFVVLNDGTITAIECSLGLENIINEDLYKSLDIIFVAKTKCEKYNICADLNNKLYSVTNCLTGEK